MEILRKAGSTSERRPFSPKRKRLDSEGGESFFSIPDEGNTRTSWAGVTKENQQVKDNVNVPKTSWRNKANILHGTSKENECFSFAVDVSLAVYGLAKDTTEEKLKAYLETKDLNVVECKLLTNFVKEARALTFKVTIKAKDLEKAKQAEIWPYRVGVRMYKHFSTKPKPDQLTFDNQTTQKGIRPLHPAGRRSSPTQDKPTPIEISNRFGPLQTDVESDFIF